MARHSSGGFRNMGMSTSGGEHGGQPSASSSERAYASLWRESSSSASSSKGGVTSLGHGGVSACVGGQYGKPESNERPKENARLNAASRRSASKGFPARNCSALVAICNRSDGVRFSNPGIVMRLSRSSVSGQASRCVGSIGINQINGVVSYLMSP